MRKYIGVLTVVCVVLLLMGNQSLAQETKVLVMAENSADVGSLDSDLANTSAERHIADAVHDGLYRFVPGKYETELDLAESVTVSDDRMVWTFKLREGVMFHPFPGYPNGHELTSDDVVFSLLKSSDPARSSYSGSYSGIIPEAIDKYTVRLTLESLLPIGDLPKILSRAGGFITSRRAVEALGEDSLHHPVGTGPFKFEKYIPAEIVVLSAFENHFRGKAKLDGVEYVFLGVLPSLEAAIRNGEVHFGWGQPEQTWFEKAQGWSDVHPVRVGPNLLSKLHLNITKSPLDDIRVRKAIAYAIDRAELNAFVGENISYPAYAPISNDLPEAVTREDVAEAGLLYAQDVQKARSLLEQAGYESLTISLYISSQSGYLPPMENVQAQLKKAGIFLELRVIDHATYHTYIRDDLNPIVEYNTFRPTTNMYMTQFYYGPSTVVEGESPITNFSHFDAADGIIEAAREARTQQEGTFLWKAAQLRALADCIVVPLFNIPNIALQHNSLDWGYEVDVAPGTTFPPVTVETDIVKY